MNEPSRHEPAASGGRAAPGPRGPRRRLPLIVRRQTERREARQRVEARTQVPLSKEQLALDPLASRRRGLIGVALGAAAIAGSLVLHVASLGSSLLLGRLDRHERQVIDQPVKIEVREPPPPPPPVVEELPPEPADVPAVEPPPKTPKPKPQKVAALPPAPEPKTPPPEAPNEPPPRVVGLSLESTAAGGDGPSFAVGNTREGATGKRAADPKNVVAGATGAIVEQPTTNQAASRIPIAGVQYIPPQQKRPRVEPRYPETLKSQGIEAVVKVMVRIDERGLVTEAKILKGTPYPEFNAAALVAARAQQWEPARRSGVPMPSPASYEYRFFLEEGQ